VYFLCVCVHILLTKCLYNLSVSRRYASAQELARAKSEVTIAHAYVEIIRSRFEDSGFKPLGGEVRFLPPFVQKR